MYSKLFIFSIFAIVLMLVVAQDYEESEDGDGESDDSGGEGGGDYDSSGGEEEAAAGDGEEGDDSSAANMASLMASALGSRKKRSVETDSSERILTRVRRGGHGRVGPVYTYQKTDHHANFKWGVKHKVGKEYGHGK